MIDHKGQKYLDEFEKWLISYLKSDADTSWIRFLNVNGSQYDYAGRKRRNSSDHHLHLEVQDGKQSAITGLMAAWKKHKNPPAKPTTAPPMPEIYNRLGFIAEARLKQMEGDPKVWLTGRGKKAHVKNPTELRAIQAYMKARSLPADVEKVKNPIPGTEV